jgi:hypothetical protein
MQMKLRVIRETEHTVEVTGATGLALSAALRQTLKEIAEKRAKLDKKFAAKLRDCRSLPSPAARDGCARQAQERFDAETKRLDKKEKDKRQENTDIQTALGDMVQAAVRRRDRVLAEVAFALDSLATQLKACAETACGSTGVSVTPAFGCPSEILPTLAFAGPRQPKSAKFYRQWNIPTAEVTSLHEVIDALAAAPGPIKRIRLKCHADPGQTGQGSMELATFKAASKKMQPPHRLEAPELLRLAEGDCAYFRYILFTDVPDTTFVGQLIAGLDPSAAYFTALTLDQPTDLLTELVSWLFLANLPVRRLTIKPEQYGMTKADFLRAGRIAADDLKRRAATSLDAQALDELDDAIRMLIQNDHHSGYVFNDNSRDTAKKTKSAVAALGNGFRNALATAKQNLTPGTSLDLRGCLLTYISNDFLTAMAGLLALDPARVSAPRWFTTEGQSGGPLLTNRCGLVILHPADFAGLNLEIGHTDGSREVTKVSESRSVRRSSPLTSRSQPPS